MTETQDFKQTPDPLYLSEYLDGHGGPLLYAAHVKTCQGCGAILPADREKWKFDGEVWSCPVDGCWRR
jgi:hypothetical protein